ncbi:MAG: 30S ribosomal protein S27e, partial [Nitrososphaerota archaeon]
MSEVDWKKIIPRPKSRFLLVACQECNNEQIVFDSAKTKVTCRICGTT